MIEILSQLKNLVKKLLPTFLIGGYHFGLAFLAALVYRFPGQRVKVIGVTGTSGKSTVVAMLSDILEAAGFRVASLSSIRFLIAGNEEQNTKRMTLPGRSFVQQFLRKAVKANCQYAILEITSEGIVQHRHRFINFEAVVLTNLSPEHIEAHGGFENYRQAKGRLFRAAKKIHILNLDDEHIDYFLQFKAREKWGCTIENPKSKIQIPNKFHISLEISGAGISNSKILKAEKVQTTAAGSRFFVDDLEFNLKLLGEFNISNALAAICTAQSQGISLGVCQKALEKVEGLPGRMEKVISGPFTVFVDYAITPVALEKVYQALVPRRIPDTRYQMPDTKLICVLGSCGGGRDKWKRPVLGKLAGQYCQEVIVTNEDPYDEDPQAIIDQVASGAESQSAVWKIIDRREAIAKSLSLAKDGDTVIITGKGCEPSICLAGGKQMPWDDRQVVKEEFAKIYAR